VERFAYRRANRIVTISHSFADNLRRKGVPDAKLDVVYNPATRGIAAAARPFETQPEVPTLLYMGNIGHSQGLERFVEAFERSPVPARLVVVGTGERAKDVVAAIRSDRVSYEGVVSDRRLARELDAASVGLVTQRPDVVEFNLPSKLMTLMGAALPVLACVSPTSETARIVDASGGGVVGDSRDPEAAIEELGRLLGSRERLAACSEGALAYARAQFEPGHVSAAFEDAIRRAVGG
jgi:colanic acid biosynthesis glycosyl transferase WcaI